MCVCMFSFLFLLNAWQYITGTRWGDKTYQLMWCCVYVRILWVLVATTCRSLTRRSTPTVTRVSSGPRQANPALLLRNSSSKCTVIPLVPLRPSLKTTCVCVSGLSLMTTCVCVCVRFGLLDNLYVSGLSLMTTCVCVCVRFGLLDNLYVSGLGF